MIQKGTYKIHLVFLILWSLLTLSSQAQNHKYLVINGIVVSEKNSQDSCSILITKNNIKTIKAPIASHGRFRLELDYNSEYTLIFIKKGNFSKTVVVKTKVPGKVIAENENFQHFMMAVKLNPETVNPENKFPENQVQYISYFPQTNSFGKVPGINEIDHSDKARSTASAVVTLQVSKTRLQAYQIF